MECHSWVFEGLVNVARTGNQGHVLKLENPSVYVF